MAEEKDLFECTWIKVGTAELNPSFWIGYDEEDSYSNFFVCSTDSPIKIPVISTKEAFYDSLNGFDRITHILYVTNDSYKASPELYKPFADALWKYSIDSLLLANYDFVEKAEYPEYVNPRAWRLINRTETFAAEQNVLPGQSSIFFGISKSDVEPAILIARRNNADVDGITNWDKSGSTLYSLSANADTKVFIFYNQYANVKYYDGALSESFGLGWIRKITADDSYEFGIYGIYDALKNYYDIVTDAFDIFYGNPSYKAESIINIVTGASANPSVIVVDGSNIYDKGGTTEPTPTNPKLDENGNKIGTDVKLPGSGQPGFGQLGTGDAGTENSNVDSTAAGLFRSYAMTLSQVNNFGSKLWSKGILDSLAKYFDDPLKVVLGLIEYPFPITAHGDDKEITFSWIPDWANPLNVTGAPLNSEYVTVSFGSLQVPRYSGTFYDFQPYTTAQVYIPYVGFVPVKYSEIVGSSLTLEYTVSLTSGVAIANLVSGKIGVIGSYNCTVGRMLPLTSANFGALYMSVIKAAVIGVATAGVGIAASAALGTASAMAGMSESSLGYATALESLGANSTANLVLDQAINQEALAMQAGQRGAKLGSMAKRGRQAFGSSAINAVANANAPIQRSSSLDAISGRCAKQKAFVLISIPHQNVPTLYNGLIGYPSNIGGTLGQFSGYFEARSIQIQAEGATAVEISELEDILRGGIYIG